MRELIRDLRLFHDFESGCMNLSCQSYDLLERAHKQDCPTPDQHYHYELGWEACLGWLGPALKVACRPYWLVCYNETRHGGEHVRTICKIIVEAEDEAGARQQAEKLQSAAALGDHDPPIHPDSDIEIFTERWDLYQQRLLAGRDILMAVSNGTTHEEPET